MIEKYKRTNLFIIDEEAWNWAQYRSKTLGYRSTSEYLFELIKLDRREDVLGKEKKVEKRTNH
ncbi:MAG: hypothetical protein ACP5K1_03465 [Candidatus Bathyarchaeia archaeon]